LAHDSGGSDWGTSLVGSLRWYIRMSVHISSQEKRERARERGREEKEKKKEVYKYSVFIHLYSFPLNL
jgi:hypothetical protein